MLTSGEVTQSAVPDAPTARGGAVCASSAAAEATRAEDATSGLEVVPPAAGSAAPVPQTTGKPTEVVVTANDAVVEPSVDPVVTTNGTMAAQVDSLAVVATTDGAATVNDGLAMGTQEASDSIALVPTASRKRTKKAAEPAIRRSARIRERTERHVHWTTVAPDARQPAAPRTAPRAAPDAFGTSPRCQCSGGATDDDYVDGWCSSDGEYSPSSGYTRPMSKCSPCTTTCGGTRRPTRSDGTSDAQGEDGDDAGGASGIDEGGDKEALDEGRDQGEHDEGDDRDGGRCSNDSERDKQRRGNDEWRG
ncbi:hypothetical protein PF004_g30454 [Phytophthora fragariae]|uniref:Uncharacterized protein n=1 Tax=Phytophthora fragariae TaxID=53985 RepID=A0A6G0MCL6_9STRA|nr:hypothetical protein PF004_g30454 [Phytophthora fragariae]